VTNPDDLDRWRAVLARLRRGPAPRGERFELCREVLAAAPDSDEGRTAARVLLEGAMADAGTSIADAQEVMQALRELSRGRLEIADLVSDR
jgi:hypothetical protein